jgi:hypothetical protein
MEEQWGETEEEGKGAFDIGLWAELHREGIKLGMERRKGRWTQRKKEWIQSDIV